MKFDKPSLAIGIAILMVALMNYIGALTDDLAFTGFILVLVMGYAKARQEVCRLKSARTAA